MRNMHNTSIYNNLYLCFLYDSWRAQFLRHTRAIEQHHFKVITTNGKNDALDHICKNLLSNYFVIDVRELLRRFTLLLLLHS